MKLSKIYEPLQYEPRIYSLWESAKAFAPNPDTSNGTFSLVLPPPNANGNLHIGHGLIVAIEDSLIRYHRMQGKSTLFVPGADHAGFETWVVYERQLEKEGKSRFDFSREELYNNVWQFVASHRGNMEVQLRELGASVDWDSMTFTLDEKVIETAYDTFKKLWDDKLIYRGKRLVNYCTTHHTAFADIEVEYKDRNTPLYYLKYGPFELATTRPETKFGDTAVAVHPDDERYKQYVGQEIEIEGVNGPFKVVVIADEHVDPAFGTGVVKITPAHDFNDWEVGERHNLPTIQVIDLDGKMNDKAGTFAGMTVLEAREAVVKALKDKGLLLKVDQHYKNRVGVCYKCGTVIEPMPLDQWFSTVKPLAAEAVKALKTNKIAFTPDSKRQVLINYLENLKDWNLSRQIPWGIPIPAFQNVNDPDDWIYDTRVDQPTIEINGKTYKREEDTFDTWFSSGQWPYITTDYLSKGQHSKFYPLNIMETGDDILFPWVSRMIMLGLYRTGKIPFKTVYLNGLVLDEHGLKMSKSKNNVVNPIEIVKEYGSDALRMGLLANRSPGVGQPYAPDKVLAGRNFCNKLWNISRFVEDKLGENYTDRNPNPTTPADHWILRQLSRAGERIGELLEQYRFSEAYEVMYHVIWDDLADWYIENSKVAPNGSVMAYALECALKLAHPFAPFVTETIWQTLDWEESLLITSRWPKISGFDEGEASKFDELMEVIIEARFLTHELGQGKQTLLYSDDELIQEYDELIERLGRLKEVRRTDEPKGLRLAIAKHAAWLDVSKHTLHQHQQKLVLRLEECRIEITKLSKRLENKSYVDNAPTSVVQETRDQLAEFQTIEERLERELQITREV